MSVRHEEEKEQESLHVIIRYTHTDPHLFKDLHMIQDSDSCLSFGFRSRTKSVYHRLSLTELPDIPSVPELAKVTADNQI